MACGVVSEGTNTKQQNKNKNKNNRNEPCTFECLQRERRRGRCEERRAERELTAKRSCAAMRRGDVGAAQRAAMSGAAASRAPSGSA